MFFQFPLRILSAQLGGILSSRPNRIHLPIRSRLADSERQWPQADPDVYLLIKKCRPRGGGGVGDKNDKIKRLKASSDAKYLSFPTPTLYFMVVMAFMFFSIFFPLSYKGLIPNLMPIPLAIQTLPVLTFLLWLFDEMLDLWRYIHWRVYLI